MAPWGITYPWLVAVGLLVGLVALAFAWRRGSRARMGGVATTAAAAMLMLGAAGPWVRELLPQRRLLVLAVDMSDSVGDLERRRAAQLIQGAWIAGAPARRAVIAFGATAKLVVAPGEPLPDDLHGALMAADVGHHASWLEPALGLAATLRRADEPSHCIVYTDGAVQRDDPRAPPMLISTVPLAPTALVNAVVCEGLEGPDVAEAGAPVALSVRYRAAAPAKVEVVVTDGTEGAPGDEVLMREERALLPGGPHLLTLPSLLLAAGAHVLTATIRIDDPLPEDNRAVLALEVLDPPPITVVTRHASGLGAQLIRQALAAQGLPTETLAPDAITDDALGATRVLVWDQPGAADAVSPVGERVAEWVRGGGGLVVITGMTETPGEQGLGTVLPATIPKPPPPPPPPDPPPSPEPPKDPPPDAPKKPREIEFVPVGIVLVIDKSGSMQGRKIRLAREAAIATLQALDPRDRFGVLAFDEETRWVLNPSTPIPLDAAVDRIARLAAGGGTNIYPALMAARDAIRDLPVGVRHVILLSDGQDENVRDFRTLVESMAQRRVTLSTIGVGEAFDSNLLTRLAAWGRGHFDFTVDAERVPALVAAQARWALDRARPPGSGNEEPKPPTPDGPPPTPPTDPPPDGDREPDAPKPLPLRAGAAHPITARLFDGPLPSLTALRTVEPRPGSLTLFDALDPNAQDAATPAMVLGHAADGRVLVIAADLSAEATAELGRWPRFSAFAAQAARFLGPPPSPPAVIDATLRYVPLPADPAAPLIGHAVFAVRGGPGDDLVRLVAARRNDDGEDSVIELQRTGPGRWEGRFPAPPPGAVTMATATLSSTAEPPELLVVHTVGAVRGPAPESTHAPDPGAVMDLKVEGGGWFGPNDATIKNLIPIPERPRSVAWWCYLLAGLLLLPVAWGQRDE